jgi:short-subunit dehydrogenase
MASLNNKNVVITGGGAGIGREMALLFASEKANLALVDINTRTLAETAETLSGVNVHVKTYMCDVSEKKEIEQLADRVKRDFEFVDVLVNNAGIAVGKTIIDSSYDDIRKTVDVNLMGLIWMTKQFLPDMVAANRGHIVNIASAAGMLAVPRLADYCATKFAVIGFSDALRMEMKKYGHTGIKVSCICPSVIDTGMFAGFRAPILSPILKPRVVAEKIVKTVKKERSYLKTPFMVKLIPLFKFLPAGLVDKLGDLTGTTRAMDHFKGHPRGSPHR